MYLIRRVFVMGSNKHNNKTTNKNHEKAKTAIITVSIGTPYLLIHSVSSDLVYTVCKGLFVPILLQ